MLFLFRITHYLAVPTMFIDVVNDKDIDKYDLTTLQTAMLGGAPITAELMKKIEEKLRISDVIVSYFN